MMLSCYNCVTCFFSVHFIIVAMLLRLTWQLLRNRKIVDKMTMGCSLIPEKGMQQNRD